MLQGWRKNRHASVRNAPPRDNAIYGADKRARSEGNLKPHVLGRWPANVLHDGSPEVEAAFAAFGERTSGAAASGGHMRRASLDAPMACSTSGLRSGMKAPDTTCFTPHTGSASPVLLFGQSLTSEHQRVQSIPTIKPLALMRWLVRLVTPPGGTVLDPFAGSGTTGAAAEAEGFNAILIERDRASVADCRTRLPQSDMVW